MITIIRRKEGSRIGGRVMPGRSRRRELLQRGRIVLGALLLGSLITGCTSLRQWCHNHWKVGPNYARPPAPVADKWIDQEDPRLHTDPEEHRRWWTVFQDPILEDLICAAYQQNLTLREESFRILELQAILGTVIGRIFPQEQFANGSYERIALSREVANRQFIPERFFSNWTWGLNLLWELDVWGKYRRNIEAAQAELDAGVEGYDQRLVNILAEVASNYTEYRVLEQQLEFLRTNVALQEETLKIATARFKGGLVSELDVDQAESILQQTKAEIPQFQIRQRIVQNRLCVLLGIPPVDLAAKLGARPIPAAPTDVIVGVPADLLRRRPDVRQAERRAASECARIGVAESEFYPAISIGGQIGYQAEAFPDLFNPQALRGTVGPGFQWKLLNYGRIANDVLRTEARFQEAVMRYQETVLKAHEEVENGVVRFLKAQQRTRELVKSVQAAQRAVKIAIAQYRSGQVDFNRVSLLEQNLVQQQNLEAEARGEIAQGLIEVYRSLGGGWQIRLDGCHVHGATAASLPAPTTEKMDTPSSLPTPRLVPLIEPDDKKPSEQKKPSGDSKPLEKNPPGEQPAPSKEKNLGFQKVRPEDL